MEIIIYDPLVGSETRKRDILDVLKVTPYKYMVISKSIYDQRPYRESEISGIRQTLAPIKTSDILFAHGILIGKLFLEVYVNIKDVKNKNSIFLFNDIKDYYEFLNNPQPTVRIYNFNENRLENLDEKLFLKLVYDNKLLEYIDAKFEKPAPKVVKKDAKDMKKESSYGSKSSYGSDTYGYTSPFDR